MTNASGTVDKNIEIGITCTTNTYTLGGTISGLNGDSLKITNNDRDEITVQDGSFTFPEKIGAPYSKKISDYQTTKTCSIVNGNGWANVNASNIVQIYCAPCNGTESNLERKA